MNAVTSNRHVPVVHPTHKFRLLLRREFWEHKGGFLWAPVISSGVALTCALMALVTGEVLAARHPIDVNGESYSISTFLSHLSSEVANGNIKAAGGIVDLVSMLFGAVPFIALTFVVFFYCLGSLYDERKDRSVLFWKSLPLSDKQTVLSKALSGIIVAPAISTVVAVVTIFAFLMLASLVLLVHGGNPGLLIWGPGHPLSIGLRFLALLPIYALWSLPTIGWLLLCSAWAKSKPFLWALVIPIASGIFISWFEIMQLFNLQASWFWKNVVARMLLGTVPVSWTSAANFPTFKIEGPGDFNGAFNLESMYSIFSTPQLWLGVLAGLAMILIAIRLRRWRDEG